MSPKKIVKVYKHGMAESDLLHIFEGVSVLFVKNWCVVHDLKIATPVPFSLVVLIPGSPIVWLLKCTLDNNRTIKYFIKVIEN